MSYQDPEILLLASPSALDSVIQSIQEELAGLTWLQKCFGRAWTFRELDDKGATITIPKVYSGAGEYLNVLPNDHLQAQAFFATRGPETWPSYTPASQNPKQRPLKIIFWFNLQAIDKDKGYPFTEELKGDVERILRAHPAIVSIDAFADDQVEQVFEGYTLAANSQYLMYPYAGFRFDVTVGYWEEC